MHVLWTISQYVTAAGGTPFGAWVSKLQDRRGKASILMRLGRLEIGNFGDCQIIGGGVFELRVHFGPGYRIYFGKIRNEIVLLLLGGDKGSQQRDISKSLQFWDDYKRRKDEAISSVPPRNN